MKTTRLILPGLLLCACLSCEDKKRNNVDDTYGTTTGASTAGGDVVAPADNTRTFSDEMEDYRVRINRRIDELDNEIEEARRERKIEKDRKKLENYDDRIRDRELRRKNFQQRLDRFENQTEESWENTKRELDELFNGDVDVDKDRDPDRDRDKR